VLEVCAERLAQLAHPLTWIIEFAQFALDEPLREIAVAQQGDGQAQIGETDRPLTGCRRDRSGFNRLMVTGREACDSRRGLSERDLAVARGLPLDQGVKVVVRNSGSSAEPYSTAVLSMSVQVPGDHAFPWRP
jgi:hypothetical protein